MIEMGRIENQVGAVVRIIKTGIEAKIHTAEIDHAVYAQNAQSVRVVVCGEQGGRVRQRGCQVDTAVDVQVPVGGYGYILTR